ncbi:WD40-repeat-containing domain protein [Suillus variegatus]|nr:WD40-repeat-containing domain protein [Suillus variegatus]
MPINRAWDINKIDALAQEVVVAPPEAKYTRIKDLETEYQHQACIKRGEFAVPPNKSNRNLSCPCLFHGFASGPVTMASTSTRAAAMKRILTPSMALKGHREQIKYISYFPDGQRIITGSNDKTTRQWDLKAGKEIEDARDVCEGEVEAVARSVAVSRDGRWLVTGGGNWESGDLKTCEVETGIVKRLEGHSLWINCIDISMDSKLLASGSEDETARIWNRQTRGWSILGLREKLRC